MIKEIVFTETLAEAVLEGRKDGSAYIGGGTWLLSRTTWGQTGGLCRYIALDKLSLRYIRQEEESCRIGAKTTFQDLVESSTVLGIIRRAALCTASRTVRNMATVGGDVSLWGDDSVLAPVLWSLDAGVSIGAEKDVPVREIRDKKRTYLIREICIPDCRRCGDVMCLSRTAHGRKSLVVAVTATAVASRIEGLKIVVSDCRGALTRLEETQAALEGSALPERDKIEELVSAEVSPEPDLHASREYKKYMAGVIVADILKQLAREGAAG